MEFSKATLFPVEIRHRLADDPLVGGGNLLAAAVVSCPRPDLPLFACERPVIDAHGKPKAVFTLNELHALAESWSARYLAEGVKPRDRVAVYVSDGFEDIVQLFALAQIGAIAVLINGHMAPHLAAGLCERTGAIGAYTDVNHCSALLGALPNRSALRVLVLHDAAEPVGEVQLNERDRYQHHKDDPVFIFHSSGTTGVPKAVVWTHNQSIEGIRHLLRSAFALSGLDPAAPFRDTGAALADDSTDGYRHLMLSAVPQSHSAGMSFAAGSLLTGVPMTAMSDLSARAVIGAIERYRPTMVTAFSATYADMAALRPGPERLSSVSTWFNTGDSAHRRHVEPLVNAGRRQVGGRWVSGSEFIDGLGSSELGFAQFLHVLTKDSLRADRCVGNPHVFADPVVLRADGSVAEPYEVGLLGVRSPTVTPGYWNDSDLTYRSLLRGYWLSGDLVYQDTNGLFYHLDRAVDAFETATGPAYSLLMEEIILANVSEIVDCSVVGVPYGETHSAVALVTPVAADAEPGGLLALVNEALRSHRQPELSMLELSRPSGEAPLGPTGKVLKRQLRERFADAWTSGSGTLLDQRAYAEGRHELAKADG